MNSDGDKTKEYLGNKDYNEGRNYKISQDNFNFDSFKNISKEYIDGKIKHLSIKLNKNRTHEY